MNDLISKSEVLELLYKIFDEYCMSTDKNTSILIKSFGSFGTDVFKKIKEMPTAYSVDKVVERLELHSFELGTDTLPVHYVRLNEAIEIVKQGGVSDNMCEWRLCDEEANVYDTSCRNPHILIEGTPKENNYEYCPYCGKKIKVVE